MRIACNLIALSLFASTALAAHDGHSPKGPTFSTLITTSEQIEGLTGDNRGNLYVGTRFVAGSCPVYRINIDTPGVKVLVGSIPAASTINGVPNQCSTLGLAFDHGGMLYVTETDKIYRLLPDAKVPPVAAVFATGVPGANGVAFDRDDNLWVSDGGSGQGRVWRLGPSGVPEEMFRIPPLANPAGVGRQVVPLTNTPAGAAVTIFANGLAFTTDGDLIVADTSRGALWKVRLDRYGNVLSPMGCDTTFTATNTLCLENVLVAHPLLEGADGIALDRAGNIWVDANERNAVVVVDQNGKDVRELFRSAPDAASGLRNGGPLEFPTSPFLSEKRFCTTSSDLGRRDNFPNTAGEVAPGTGAVGKISCMDQPLSVQGLRLPVR
jgi:sugar lactone lactonase YvrE